MRVLNFHELSEKNFRSEFYGSYHEFHAELLLDRLSAVDRLIECTVSKVRKEPENERMNGRISMRLELRLSFLEREWYL